MSSPRLSIVLLAVAACGNGTPPPGVATTRITAASDDVIASRLVAAKRVLEDAVGDDGHKIPDMVAAHTTCVAIVPGAFTGGSLAAHYRAAGVVTCRTGETWSNPGFFVLTAGDRPIAVDPAATDLVILAANERGRTAFIDGEDGLSGLVMTSATAPTRREARSRTTLTCYARSPGGFTGVELGGVFLKPDSAANQAYYRRERWLSQILDDPADPPAGAATTFASTVDKVFGRMRPHPRREPANTSP